jgi:hypothetical protein
MLGSWQCEWLAGHIWALLGGVMFRKLADLFRRQKASAVEPVEKPSSINVYGSHEKTEVARFGAPIQRGRPIRNRPPPDQPGLYRFINKKTGKMDYFGTTKSLSNRQKAHERSGKFNGHYFSFQPAKPGVSATALYEHEVKKIKKHRPRLNRNIGGGGPRWTASIPAPAPNRVSETAPPAIPSKPVP